MKFSERIGKTSVRSALQIDGMDVALKNRIWNVILEDFFTHISDYQSGGQKSQKAEVCEAIWKEFFGLAIDEIPSWQGGGTHCDGVIEHLRDWYFSAQWYEIYNLVELLVSISEILRLDFTSKCNKALKKEMSAYRIVDSFVTQVTSEEEIVELEMALDVGDRWSSVKTHLTAALAFYSNRPSPDFRNSIKESISAVEALCVIITGDPNATLGQALIVIEKKWKIHGALKSALSALYGYTSDAGGIRHSLMEGDTEIASEDARFMLISCSAFINYLISKTEI